MAPSIALRVLVASLLLLPSALAAGLYNKDSGVVQVDGSTYDALIAKSNKTSIVEFYAPWCGHCQNLKPAYEKAAKSLAGLAKVAAVNCDDEMNKPFCGRLDIKGFPTLKIFRPGSKKGKPVIEDYNGARSAKAIVEAVIDKIPNHVKRVSDKDYEEWLIENEGPRAILFSDKGSTSPMLKAIAIDFLGGISIGQMRDKDVKAKEAFGVTEFPALVLIPGLGKEAIRYDGELKQDAITAFLSQAAAPNPDPAPNPPKKSKTANAKAKSKASKASSSFAEASASQASKEAETAKASQTLEDLENEGPPTASPDPKVVPDDAPKPVEVPDAAPSIPELTDSSSLLRNCLTTKSGTCVLALTASTGSEAASQAIVGLSDIRHKYEKAGRGLFPFFQVATSNPDNDDLRQGLGLRGLDTIEIVAINAKRGWYRSYPHSSYTQRELEEWIDAIRMGDGKKETIPEGLVVEPETIPDERIRVDASDPEAIREAMAKENFQEGVDFEMEEISDAEMASLLAEASKAAAAREAEETAKAQEHIEL